MNIFYRYILTPLVALIMIGLIEAATRFIPGYTPSLALAFLALFISSILFLFGFDVGGLWSQLAVATIITVYAVISSEFDAWRAGQIAVVAYLGALASGHRIRRYRLAKSTIREQAETVLPTNGNRASLATIREYMYNIERSWEALSDRARRSAFQDAINDMANLEQKAVIWRQMARDRGFIEQSYEKSTQEVA